MILTTTTTTSQEAPGLQRQSRQASPELSFLCWPRVHSGAEDNHDDADDYDGEDDGDDGDDDHDDDDSKQMVPFWNINKAHLYISVNDVIVMAVFEGLQNQA